jgi:hypothetical protein
VLFLLTGCTETIDSVSREYRNATNEGIDALMMITDDRSAEIMRSRVFVHLSSRFKTIDEHFQVVKDNRSNIDFIKEMLESDGFQMYFTESTVNAERFWMEVQRIENVADIYIKKKRDADNDFASSADEVRQKACPNLAKFCRLTEQTIRKGNELPKVPSELETLYMQVWDVSGPPDPKNPKAKRQPIENGQFPRMIQAFNGLDNMRGVQEKDLKKYKEIFAKRRPNFEAKR